MRRTIELEFSEVDRQAAERYADNENCIVATALKNRGLNAVSVSVYRARLEDDDYVSNDMGCRNVCFNFVAIGKPFYHPEVVGKKLVLVSERDDYDDAEKTQELAEVVA